MSDRFVSGNPGRDVQRVGTARFLGQDPQRSTSRSGPSPGTSATASATSACIEKVDAIQAALAARIRDDDLPVRLIAPAYTLGVSDGQLNGTDRMRYSLIGRELANDAIDAHLNANDVQGLIAVVACDKPPVGTLAAVLEHNEPAVFLSDGSIKPGIDPDDRRAHRPRHRVPDRGRSRSRACARRSRSTPAPARAAAAACSPTTPCRRSSPSSAWSRCTWSRRPPTTRAGSREFPERARRLPRHDRRGRASRRATSSRRQSLRNALDGRDRHGRLDERRPPQRRDRARRRHRPLEGRDEPGTSSTRCRTAFPVLVNARPFGFYSMVDIDAKGGLQVIVKQLLDAGFLDGSCLTCTGETLAEQVRRLEPPAPDGEVIHPVARAVQDDRRPPPPARQPRARGRRHPEGRRRRGRHRGRHLHRPRARLQQRARAHRRPRGHAGRRSPTTTWSSSATRVRAARPACRSSSIRRRASRRCAAEAHHDRAHDRRPLLRRLRRPRHRPRRAGGLPRRPDRADRERRHDRRRPERGPPRLPRARRRGASARAAPPPGGRPRSSTAACTRP